MNARHLLTFHAPGVPVPGGSKRGFIIKSKSGGQRVAMSDMGGARGKDWSSVLKLAASQAMDGRAPFDEPLELTVLFQMPRPRGHYGTGKRSATLKASAPVWHVGAPDATKLMRRLEDALKAIVWRDDSLVCVQRAWKVYANDASGAVVQVMRAEESPTIEWYAIIDDTRLVIGLPVAKKTAGSCAVSARESEE